MREIKILIFSSNIISGLIQQCSYTILDTVNEAEFFPHGVRENFLIKLSLNYTPKKKESF